MVELHARLEVPAASTGDGAGPGTLSARSEVRDALGGLGYGPEEVREVLALIADDGPVEDLLREALRHLAVARR
jgi:Holliday junction DNA helicase RuvA